MTDVGITKIGEGCPQLQELYLDSCTEVTDAGISKIKEGCPQLQLLSHDIDDNTDDSDDTSDSWDDNLYD